MRKVILSLVIANSIVSAAPAVNNFDNFGYNQAQAQPSSVLLYTNAPSAEVHPNRVPVLRKGQRVSPSQNDVYDTAASVSSKYFRKPVYPSYDTAQGDSSSINTNNNEENDGWNFNQNYETVNYQDGDDYDWKSVVSKWVQKNNHKQYSSTTSSTSSAKPTSTSSTNNKKYKQVNNGYKSNKNTGNRYNSNKGWDFENSQNDWQYDNPYDYDLENGEPVTLVPTRTIVIHNSSPTVTNSKIQVHTNSKVVATTTTAAPSAEISSAATASSTTTTATPVGNDKDYHQGWDSLDGWNSGKENPEPLKGVTEN